MFDLLKTVCGDECIVDSEKTMLWCDGGTALKKAIASLEKLDGHRECNVHLKKNFLKRFHKLQTYFYALSDAMTEHDFNHAERALKAKNVKAWEYLFEKTTAIAGLSSKFLKGWSQHLGRVQQTTWS